MSHEGSVYRDGFVPSITTREILARQRELHESVNEILAREGIEGEPWTVSPADFVAIAAQRMGVAEFNAVRHIQREGGEFYLKPDGSLALRLTRRVDDPLWFSETLQALPDLPAFKTNVAAILREFIETDGLGSPYLPSVDNAL